MEYYSEMKKKRVRGPWLRPGGLHGSCNDSQICVVNIFLDSEASVTICGMSTRCQEMLLGLNKHRLHQALHTPDTVTLRHS